jgi:hypothetical protein
VSKALKNKVKLNDVVSVKDFGAVGDGVADDTAAIQAAINSGAAKIYLPAGTYKITAALSVTTSAVLFVGDGAAKTFILQTSATADGIYFNHSSYLVGGGVQDLSIHAGSLFNTNTGSTGNGIRLRKANGGFSCTRIDVQAFATGIRVAESFYAKFQDFQVLYAQNYGVICDTPSGGTPSAGMFFSKGKISNFGFTGTNTSSVGIAVKQSGGDFFDTIDVTTFNTAVQVQPTGSDVVAYLFMNQVLADTSVTDGWDIDGTSANITACEFVECWAGYQTNGHGVRIRSGVDGINWSGGRIRENGKHGVLIEGGSNISFVNTQIAKNSKLTTNTYHGVSITGGSSVALASCRIGNFASGLTHEQADGVNIAVTFAGRIQITGCDVSNPGTGKSGIANNSAVLPLMTANLPRQVGYNPTNSSNFPLMTNGTVAAATTTYIGRNAQQSVEADTFFSVPISGVVSRIRLQVENAPGAGQTYTYTLRKNTADTALTGTISGAASFEVISYGAITVSDGDVLTIKLVTSAGATATRHRGYIELSG